MSIASAMMTMTVPSSQADTAVRTWIPGGAQSRAPTKGSAARKVLAPAREANAKEAAHSVHGERTAAKESPLKSLFMKSLELYH